MIEASIRTKKTTKAKGGEWVKLMIRLNWDGQRAAFGSGLVIPAEDWDADAGWIRSMRGRSDKAIELNNQRAHLRKEKEKREQLIERGYKSVIAKGREACLEEIRSYFKEDNLGL